MPILEKVKQVDAGARESSARGPALWPVEATPEAFDEDAGEKRGPPWAMAIIGLGAVATLVWIGVLIWMIGTLVMML